MLYFVYMLSGREQWWSSKEAATGDAEDRPNMACWTPD